MEGTHLDVGPEQFFQLTTKFKIKNNLVQALALTRRQKKLFAQHLLATGCLFTKNIRKCKVIVPIWETPPKKLGRDVHLDVLVMSKNCF